MLWWIIFIFIVWTGLAFLILCLLNVGNKEIPKEK
jgi:hypothetical protein